MGNTPEKVRTFSGNESTGRATFHNDNADRFIDIVSDGTYDLMINGLTMGGGLVTPAYRTTGNYTATSEDYIILADTDGGAITITLPTGINGTNYIIKNVGSSANDVTVSASEAIEDGTISDGESNHYIYESTEKWKVISNK